MFRRVMQPMLLAVAVWAGSNFVHNAWAGAERRTMDALTHGVGMWTLPVLPEVGWLTFLVVFVAVRLCASRGGTRRECIAVGLSPLALGVLWYAAVLVFSIGLSALASVIGYVGVIGSGRVTVGDVYPARTFAKAQLGLAGTCLAATWLHFRASSWQDRRRAADESDVGARQIQ